MKHWLTISIVISAGIWSGARAQSLYWLETTFASPTLKRSALDGSNVQSFPLDATSLPQGIAYDASRDSLYWVELAFTGARIIARPQTQPLTHVVVTGRSVLRDIAVEPVAGKIYWTATNLVTGSTISRASIDGSNIETLIAWQPGGQEEPRGIAVHLTSGRIYWTDFNTGMIRRASLTGTTQENVLTNLAGPVAIRIDDVSGKMYWTEANGFVVKRANLNGSNVEVLVTTTGSPNYLGLDVAGGKMYWTEIGTPGIRRADLNGQNAENLPMSVNDPSGIVVVRTTGADVAENTADLPGEYSLAQNFPNPFNPSTTIQYELPAAGDLSLVIYDVLGREVAVLAEGTIPAGRYSATWNAQNAASGVYYYRIRSGSYSESRRMALVK